MYALNPFSRQDNVYKGSLIIITQYTFITKYTHADHILKLLGITIICLIGNFFGIKKCVHD